LITT